MSNLSNPKVIVVGAGAMGSLFGGLLAEGGLDVTLVDVWQDHVDAINTHGLKMVGHGGDRMIPVKATSDPTTIDEADAVFFQCKASNFSITPCTPFGIGVMSGRDQRSRAVGVAHVRPAIGQRPNGRRRALCPEGAPWRTLRAQGPYGCGESSKKGSLHGVIEKLPRPSTMPMPRPASSTCSTTTILLRSAFRTASATRMRSRASSVRARCLAA